MQNSWILLVMIPPFLWAVNNHLDKYLVARYTKGSNIYGLVIISAIAGIVVLPFILIFSKGIFELSILNIIFLLLSGIVYILGSVFYFKALSYDEASKLIPVYNTIPVFLYFLGLFFLGEQLDFVQLTGGVVVLVGTFILTFKFMGHRRFKWQPKAIVLMLLSSLFFALYAFLFKKFALSLEFWPSIFWQYSGLVLMGLLLLSLTKYRNAFLSIVRTGSRGLLAVVYGNEGFNLAAVALANFVYLIAPIALVSVTIQAFQSVFALLIGLFLVFFFPHISKEDILYKIQALVTLLPEIPLFFKAFFIWAI